MEIGEKTDGALMAPMTREQKRDLADFGLQVVEVQNPAEKRDKSSGRTVLPNNPSNKRSTRQEAKANMNNETSHKHTAAHTATAEGAAAADALEAMGNQMSTDLHEIKLLLKHQATPKQVLITSAIQAGVVVATAAVVIGGVGLVTGAFKRDAIPVEAVPGIPVKKQ